MENVTHTTDNAYLSDGLNYMTNRDSLINKFNLCYEQFANKKGVMINLEALLRVKLVRGRNDIEVELNHFLSKSFHHFSTKDTKDHSFSSLDKKKMELLDRFARLRSFHHNLKFSYDVKLESIKSDVHLNQYHDFPKNIDFYNQAHPERLHPYASVFQNYYKKGEQRLHVNDHILTNDQFNFYKEIRDIQNNERGIAEGVKRLIDKRPLDVEKDPVVSKVYQDICGNYLTPSRVSTLDFNLDNYDYTLAFEKLVLSVNCIFHKMKQTFTDLEYFQKDETYYVKKVVEEVLGKVAEDLNTKFYFDWNIIKAIDELFYEIDNAIRDQKKDKPQIDQAWNKEEHQKTAQYIQKKYNQMNRNSIDISINRLSELLGITVTRLVLNKEDNYFNSYALEDGIVQACKLSMNNNIYTTDKHITYFVNDSRGGYSNPYHLNDLNKEIHPHVESAYSIKKYDIDFFKLYLNKFADRSDLALDMLELTYVEKDKDKRDLWEKPRDLRYDSYTLDNNTRIKFLANQIETISVEFEESIEHYSIHSKMYLTIYQILFKMIHVNRDSISDIVKKRHILITLDNLHEFLNFLSHGSVPNAYNSAGFCKKYDFGMMETAWVKDKTNFNS